MEDALYAHQVLVALYDVLNAGDADLRFYEAQLGAAPLRVLDLGCGTGLFACRLAAIGHRVTGVEPAPGMLAVARGREGSGRVRWIEGDAAALPEGLRFEAALMVGHTFQCLLTDDAIAATLARVKEALAPGGRLLFESRNPAGRPWESWTPEASATIVRDGQDRPIQVHHALMGVEGELVTFETHYGLPEGLVTSRSTLRFLSADAIEANLRHADFTRIDLLGSWDGTPFRQCSPEIIAIAC